MTNGLDPTDIWEIMKDLFSKMGIHCMRHETRQTYQDSKTLGVLVEFATTREEFLKLRAAANLADLWFSNFRFEELGTYFMYKVFVAENKKKQKR
jgi:hypothetical protein